MWAGLQLDDLEGQADVMVFPKCYAEFEELLGNDRPLMVLGRLKVEEEKAQLIADDLCLLDDLRDRQVEAMRLKIDAQNLDDEMVKRLYRIADSHRGEARLLFEVFREGSYTLTLRAESSIGVKPSPQLSHELEEVLGPDRVRYKTRALKLKPRSSSRFERNSDRVLG
jgi:DNA polymerase-3 subunit alpha